MGDVAAKAESQGSVSQLLGYGAGIGLLAVSQSAAYLYSIFAVIAPIHLAITAYMLRVATFELLTLPRLTWLSKEYASGKGRSEENEQILPYSLPSLGELERRGLHLGDTCPTGVGHDSVPHRHCYSPLDTG